MLTEAHMMMPETAELLSTPLTNNSKNKLSEIINQYSTIINKRITIVLVTGKVVGESDFDLEGMDNHLLRPEILGAVKGTTSHSIRFSHTLGQDYLYTALPIPFQNRIVGVLRLATSLESIHAEINSLRGSIITAITVTAFVVIILILLLTNRTISQLRLLIKKIDGIDFENEENFIALSRRDEIGELDKAINMMSNQINSQIKELKNERLKLESVLTHMKDGIVIVDIYGEVQLINPAAEKIFNVRAPSAIGNSLTTFVRNHNIISLWRDCVDNFEQLTATVETSPERRYINVIATPLKENSSVRCLLIFQELTRLRQLEMIRSDFVSNVSHELRTPIASLRALTDTLKEGALNDPPAAHRFLKMMDSEIDNLIQLVEELLELSRIESGKIPLDKQVTHPHELIILAVNRMKLQAERSGLTMKVNCPNNLPAIYVDKLRMEQVLTNLIHNAIKFTKPGGKIIISAEASRMDIIFSVEDTGVGIQPDVLDRIFERFYKTDRARAGKGTGLGLSIARHIVEAHGGSICAESVPEKGSTFSFRLPISNNNYVNKTV